MQQQQKSFLVCYNVTLQENCNVEGSILFAHFQVNRTHIKLYLNSMAEWYEDKIISTFFVLSSMSWSTHTDLSPEIS